MSFLQFDNDNNIDEVGVLNWAKRKERLPAWYDIPFRYKTTLKDELEVHKNYKPKIDVAIPTKIHTFIERGDKKGLRNYANKLENKKQREVALRLARYL